jgi:polyribonucleotide nucleotidyltransferase
MAAACGGSLALLDAGVPIKEMVAGISVGLVTDASYTTTLHGNGKYILLKDIIGSEDHYGDMDFKVAGSRHGVTAIQLDVKLAGGVPLSILVEALQLAKEGRIEVLHAMESIIPSHGVAVLKAHAPRAELVKIDPSRLDHLIGPRGDTIKFLQKAFRVDIQIHESIPNAVYVYGQERQGVQAAKACIEDIAVMLKEGAVIIATIVEILEYGLVVRINRAGEGFIHVSDFTHDMNLMKQPMESFVQVGQSFPAKVSNVDISSGTIKISRRMMLDKTQSTDTLQDLHLIGHEEIADMILHEVPKFPVKPPRTWSKEFFK